jgi:TetR/AcrR family transcriptional regulator, ethionamide resistance regulator
MSALRRRSRPLQKGDERERRLMETAELLLGEGSFDDTPVAALAERAGLSRPTFYFYFASKEALLASVIDVTHAEIATRISAALLAEGDAPAHRLEAAIGAAADAWWKHRAVMSAAMRLAGSVAELDERLQQSMRDADALCVELLISHGSVPESRDRRAAEALIATLALLNQRAFADASRRARRRADLRPCEQRLLTIWMRALGLPARK